jgi:arsenate reductase-like glutaredoxin family protein
MKIFKQLGLLLFFVFSSHCSSSLEGQELFAEKDIGLARGFLATPLVAKELDMTDEQLGEWDELNERVAAHMNKYLDTLSPFLPNGNAKEANKEVLRAEIANELERLPEFLLPQQTERLSQLAKRYKIRLTNRKSFYPELQVLIDGNADFDIGLTVASRKDLEQNVQDFEDELLEMLTRHRKEIKELSEKHEATALEQFTPNQRKLFKEALGPNVNFREGTIRLPGSKK